MLALKLKGQTVYKEEDLSLALDFLKVIYKAKQKQSSIFRNPRKCEPRNFILSKIVL